VWRTEEGGEKESSFSAVLSSVFFRFISFVRSFFGSLARTDMHRSVVPPLLSFTHTLHSDLPPLLYSLFIVSLTRFSPSPRLSRDGGLAFCQRRAIGLCSSTDGCDGRDRG
jgi:hypothetical protein